MTRVEGHDLVFKVPSDFVFRVYRWWKIALPSRGFLVYMLIMRILAFVAVGQDA